MSKPMSSSPSNGSTGYPTVQYSSQTPGYPGGQYANNPQSYNPSYPGTGGTGQPMIVMVNSPPMVVQPQVLPRSFCGHICLSCFVVWCCGGCLFGLIAFILALVAADKETSGRKEEATQLGKASLGVSIAGIVVAVVVAAVILGIGFTSEYYKSTGNFNVRFG